MSGGEYKHEILLAKKQQAEEIAATMNSLPYLDRLPTVSEIESAIEHNSCLIYLVAGSIIGIAILYTKEDEPGTKIGSFFIGLLPDYRGKFATGDIKYSDALRTRIIDTLERNGVKKVRVCTRHDNFPMQKFALKSGFQQNGECIDKQHEHKEKHLIFHGEIQQETRVEPIYEGKPDQS